MRRSDWGRSRCPVGASVGKLAVMLVVLAVASVALAAPKKDKNEDGNYYAAELTRVYRHTYDEVFQACQDAIERRGLLVTAADKDKGTIRGSSLNYTLSSTLVWSMHIEPVNTKPETRLTINAHWTGKGPRVGGMSSKRNQAWEDEMATVVQKVLSTYR